MKIAVLDNLRSVHNVGSIFRTCNAVGVDKIYLCGTTPTPLDHKGLKRKDFAKVALGAEETLLWEYCESTKECITKLKEEGCYILALEQDENSVDYKAVDITGKSDVALIVGHEVDGITQDILELSDATVEIPMLGTKESLNVTIAFGVAIYRILGV
jgi:23S rRNA (guanosine2251-2'-O)-methyltransferase